MKLGNYGTGRTYTYYTRSSNGGKDDPLCCFITLGIILVVGFVTFIWHELDVTNKLHTVDYITKSVQPLPEGIEGVQQISEYGFENKIVHLQNVPIKTQQISDNEFGFNFENNMGVKRTVEFCQWQEYRHESRRAVGREGNETIYETEVSYSYRLDWHSQPISSVFFDSSISYHNPQRQPIKNMNLYTQALLGDKIRLNTQLVSESPSITYEQFYIPYNAYVADYAYQNGFTTTKENGKWAYSKYQESYSFAKKAAGFMLEGVIDLGIEGKCTPGDIRASWQTIPTPWTYSLIGKVVNDQIQPVKIPNQSGEGLVLGVSGSSNVSEIRDAYSQMYTSMRFWYRVYFCILVTALGSVFLCMGGPQYFQKDKKLVYKEI